MNVSRAEAVSALLPDGTVLIAGGVDQGPPDATYPAEIYDPQTRAFHRIASTQSPRLGSAAVTLPDGRVLIAGGLRTPAGTSEIYDPTTRQFGSLVSMSGERYRPVGVMLADGRVLVAGGERNASRIATAEIWIPSTGSWATTGSMAKPRYQFAGVRLPDGTVLIAGGESGLSTPEIFNAGTGVWSSIASLQMSATAAVLLPSGKVLLLYLGNLILYDPSTRTTTQSTQHLETYTDEAVVLLPNGNVLIAGGVDSQTFEGSTEVLVYSPDSDTLTNIGSLSLGRWDATATVLSDGTILVAGGATRETTNSTAADLVDLNARRRSRAVRH